MDTRDNATYGLALLEQALRPTGSFRAKRVTVSKKAVKRVKADPNLKAWFDRVFPGQ